MSEFKSISARQIFDSRGYPTIACRVELTCGAIGCASVPAGASTGTNEVLELRDGASNLAGKSVLQAVGIINNNIFEVIKDINPAAQLDVDMALKRFDGTGNLAKVGGNTILAVSLAVARAAAKHMPLYKYLSEASYLMPVPFINMINGGVHAGNNLSVQEFMLVPLGFTSFSEAMYASFEVFYALKSKLKAFGVGDEGGFAPDFTHSRMALDSLMQAIMQAGFTPGKEFMLALDVAASELYKDGTYRIVAENIAYDSEQWCQWLVDLIADYPICSVEDGMAEFDFSGWQHLTRAIGAKTQLVGDDVFVTQAARLQAGIENKIANAVLIKPNQVGTLTDTIATCDTARAANYNFMISHRSGETADTFIADLAVATGAAQIKTGGLCRSERVEKYNRLLEIEQMLGAAARYPDSLCFIN